MAVDAKAVFDLRIPRTPFVVPTERLFGRAPIRSIGIQLTFTFRNFGDVAKNLKKVTRKEFRAVVKTALRNEAIALVEDVKERIWNNNFWFRSSSSPQAVPKQKGTLAILEARKVARRKGWKSKKATARSSWASRHRGLVRSGKLHRSIVFRDRSRGNQFRFDVLPRPGAKTHAGLSLVDLVNILSKPSIQFIAHPGPLVKRRRLDKPGKETEPRFSEPFRAKRSKEQGFWFGLHGKNAGREYSSRGALPRVMDRKARPIFQDAPRRSAEFKARRRRIAQSMNAFFERKNIPLRVTVPR